MNGREHRVWQDQFIGPEDQSFEGEKKNPKETLVEDIQFLKSR